ncbi:MAG: asparagine synthase (glutamine-hydrolyzing) [Planctomycetaceae bacterium]|nr:asparagine synthase (glutamine-hydrolyzing) [Planctomycetaceae bacterium]MCA9110524.1 asparagine synthase (glutamine-hydrolyzing) [Planctomycetaceae bacterium]
MCGIAGMIDLRGRPVERVPVRRMCNALVHRGPDADGFYVKGQVALGQRRLSIIDLSGGRQPMSNEDGSVWVSFNGEIYNYSELREELISRGHRFVSHSDTEVIVHAYEEYGVDCVRHFRGMFAFAVWDENERRLMLSRDRVGKKPLFYTECDGRLLFASEMQGLLAIPEVSRDLDITAVDDYLNFGYIPAPKTIFENVFKLPPAHSLTLELDEYGGHKQRIERYWRLDYGPKLTLDRQEAREALEEKLLEATRLRMISDVPLGVLLSGGLDSSVIAALMSRLSDRPIKTFSIGFNDSVYNELPYARKVAEHCGTDHHELVVEPQGLEILPKLVRHYGEPFADSSAIATYHVARLTREHVTVALNGDGGDECFAGYDRHLGIGLAAKYQQLPGLIRRGMIEPLTRLLPQSLTQLSRLGQIKRFVERSASPVDQQYINWITYFPASLRHRLYNDESRSRLQQYDGRSWMEELFRDHSERSTDVLDQFLGLDVESYLAYDLLVKMDIATMACSLEARSPLLDHQVMEFCASLPTSMKRQGMSSKVLLRDLAADLLPAEVLQRRKMGFGLPMASWLRSPAADAWLDMLVSPDARLRELFDTSAIQQTIDEHRIQRIDRAPRLWSLLWLEIWLQEVREQAVPSPSTSSNTQEILC